MRSPAVLNLARLLAARRLWRMREVWTGSPSGRWGVAVLSEPIPTKFLNRGKPSLEVTGDVVHRPRCKSHRLDVSCPTSMRSEEHTSELQSLMRISYAGF